MNLLRYLLRTAPGLVIFAALMALLGGACTVGLIAAVNHVLTNSGTSLATLAWVFAALCIGRLATNFISQMALARYSQQAVAELRQDLMAKILAVPLRQLEEISTPRLLVALTDDIFNITQAMLGVTGFAVNVAVLLGGAAYLGWLSWQVLLVMCALIFVGALAYKRIMSRGFHFLNEAREEEDKLFSHFRSLTDGIKELKLHRRRRGVFLGQLVQETTGTLARLNVAAELRFIIAQTWSQLLYFGLIGLILFALPAVQNISPAALTGYVVTTLYLLGPLAGVLGSIAFFGRAEVSLAKIEKLGLSLAERSNEKFSLTGPEERPKFERLELRGVTHAYQHEKDDNHFMLGPMDLTFEPGELVFLAGGNGSGKSTLAKIIAGLYPPQAGEVRLNGRLVTDKNRDDYRQLFSVVFSDFHVFERLLGLEGATLDHRAADYLKQLHLDHKVKVRNGALSTTALSQGQRKRLALLTAYLEDRPFYIFDEWASDQDPQFKETFYLELLPELKSRGKTLLVITHDDRFFHLADRLIKLDYGRFIQAGQPNSGMRPLAASVQLR